VKNIAASPEIGEFMRIGALGAAFSSGAGALMLALLAVATLHCGEGFEDRGLSDASSNADVGQGGDQDSGPPDACGVPSDGGVPDACGGGNDAGPPDACGVQSDSGVPDGGCGAPTDGGPDAGFDAGPDAGPTDAGGSTLPLMPNHCVPKCIVNADCPGPLGYFDCVNGACLIPECADDAWCVNTKGSAEFKCVTVRGRKDCVATCAADGTCANASYSCAAQDDNGVPLCVSGCASNADCSGGSTACLQGACGCGGDTDCAWTSDPVCTM